MKIYLASGNDHKKQELQEILTNYEIILPRDEGINFDPVEDGKSFFENAMIKAKALYEIVKAPVIADDSGLCIDYLNGAPGIYSARYGSENMEHASSDISIKKVLGELNGVENRNAHFACCMVFMRDENRFFSVQEICEGRITEKVYGNGGFGYDPIFFVEKFGKTFAELTADEKNSISHRGLAMKKMVKLLQN